MFAGYIVPVFSRGFWHGYFIFAESFLVENWMKLPEMLAKIVVSVQKIFY